MISVTGRYRALMLHIERHSDGRVVVAAIDRQHRRNAVDHATLVELTAALDDAAQHSARVFILTGSGGHFSAGADLTGVEGGAFQGALRQVLNSLEQVPLVTMVAVDGSCLGLGMQLAGFSDLRVATPTARFGVPAAKLGLAIDMATAARVERLCGAGPARAMLLAAQIFNGGEAAAMGLVDRLGDLDTALSWAAEIAELAPLTIAAHKAALAAAYDVGRGALTEVAVAAFDRAWASADLVEGRQAFMDKRTPKFVGR